MLRENPVLKKVVELGEEQMGKTLQHLLASERFATAVQAVMANSLKAKGLLDKNLRSALAAMNLPTSEELEGLRKKVAELQREVERLEGKVDGAPKTPRTRATTRR